jgi:hypothetical protein
MIGPGYVPTNVYRVGEKLPTLIKRVAVMPLTVRGQDSVGEAGRESLEPVLRNELSKIRLFELVWVSEEQLRLWTGQARWNSEDKLPPDLFQQIKGKLGADAVFFCQLTQYRPYRPLALGWKMQLIESGKPVIFWSADEVFDAGDVAVANGARHYYREHAQPTPLLDDTQIILGSPRRFGQYTLATLLATLPSR